VDYVPWIRLDDSGKLEAAGVRPEECLAILAEAYGRQVFDQGLFHADPHPGNVFLVDESSPRRPPGDTRPRLLFLDFGLSKRLPEPLRAELRAGLHALLRRDVGALLEGLERIGALVPGREAEAEAAITQALDAGAAEALSATPSTIAALKEVGKRLVRESRAFRVPTELLLYARTLAYVFALSERIAPGHSPMPQLLPRLLGFLASGDQGPPPTASEASAGARSGE
jgi:predicted unusual protein kinase regulating ubiquinone biosynthesis (AarF/ABC1/UbiB family)